jgi:archaellum biogenesis ATPase FlaH
VPKKKSDLEIKPYNLSYDNEVKIISYCMKNIASSSYFENQYFINEDFKLIHQVLSDVAITDKIYDSQTVMRKILNIKPHTDIDEIFLSKVETAFPDFKEENMVKAKKFLKEDYFKFVVSSGLLTEALDLTTTKAKLNFNKLRFTLTRLLEIVSDDSSVESSMLIGNQITQVYERELETRFEGENRRTLGYSSLDNAHPKIGAGKEITIIAGESGSGKSILVQAIEDRLVKKKVCVMKLALEMGFGTQMDRWMSLRYGYNINNIQFKDKNPHLYDRLKNDVNRLGTLIPNYAFSEHPKINFESLERRIVYTKNEFLKAGVLPSDEYMVIIIDLLSMISGFGTSSQEIEESMNRLHQIVKAHNVHCLGVVQTNENQQRSSKPFKNLQEVSEFRLTLKDIKNGSAYKERSRLVLILNRPKVLMERYFGHMYDHIKNEDDLLHVDIAKSNEGKLSRVTFSFESEDYMALREHRTIV